MFGNEKRTEIQVRWEMFGNEKRTEIQDCPFSREPGNVPAN